MTDNQKKQLIVDGNEACASVAYRVTELSAIYPITPSSTMGELADQWASEGKKNIWGFVPQVVEMQSEGGAAGTLHGALQAGALATTYTASQGLLLMIPNMYKIAGELTSCVIHVTARALAAQALSIFGDQSDVMAARNTGFAMLASTSPQIAHDFALIAHAATLKARVPFVHFFDGFRTSHEIDKFAYLDDDVLKAMIDEEYVTAHRERALNPNKPFIRGTSQNPDVYFQSRETVNPFYDAAPGIVKEYMQRFTKLTGRRYGLVDFYHAEGAERVVVVMGSAATTAYQTALALEKQGEKVGVIAINLYRPFPVEDFVAALPKTVKSIAVLDRTKEAGAVGEPLYQDVVTAIQQCRGRPLCRPGNDTANRPDNDTANRPGNDTANRPDNDTANIFDGSTIKIIGGRYGIGSKEFTPAMAKAVFDELKNEKPKNHFTVGINDDVGHTSLACDPSFSILPNNVTQALFYGLGADGTVGANKNSIKIIGEGTDLYTQGYFVYDSKKSGSQTVSHLRFGPEPINAPYLIHKANFIACHQFPFVSKVRMLKDAAENAVFLLNSPYSETEVWQHIPCPTQQMIIDKKIKFYVIDAYKVAGETGMGGRINTIMQTCFFALSGVLPKDEAIAQIKNAIKKTYMKKGEEVVAKNFAAVDATLANLKEVKVPTTVLAGACEFPEIVSGKAPQFVQKVTAEMMANRGDDLPVSAFPVDGTYPTGTTKWEKRNVSLNVACWTPELCIQCGQCSLVCPHGVIRAKYYDHDLRKNAPQSFKATALKDKKLGENKNFTLQVYLEDCTGCGLCYKVCPGMAKEDKTHKAMELRDKRPILEAEQKNIEFFETLPFADRSTIDMIQARSLQYAEPLFEFSGACAGCGETPYIKAISQMFGDRMMVANATGCTSIYGGNLPTTPWTSNHEGRGPAWSNSLFEDNAEFGLGMRVAADLAVTQAIGLMHKLENVIGSDLITGLEEGFQATDEKSLAAQRDRVKALKAKLQTIKDPDALRLNLLADYLIKRSVWIMGGDGWAYDIGYGGLDHVLASGRNVNVLVVDTEVYSNTGGQASKSTPRGAVAKFAAGGKPNARKDLGLMMAMYGNIYVAQIALGANQIQALRAIKEAENYNGPSIIIAYSHCIAQGFDLINGMQQQKLAVTSGFWPLYRYNPDLKAQGLNPFQLDSAEPTITFKDYALNETRFKSLTKINPAHAEELFALAQKDITEKWQVLKKMAEDKK